MRVLLFFLLFFAANAHAAAPVESAAAARARLEKTIAQLRQMETKAPRDLGKVLKTLETPRQIKRADGAIQTESGAQWTRRRQNLANPKNVKRREVENARLALEARLKALNEWATPNDGAYYLSADAQSIVDSLEKSGEIRVGPSAWQQKVADIFKAIGDAISNFWKWFTGLFPTPATPPTPPNVNFNWNWLKILFWGIVAALLGLIAILIWRALGGRWGRASKRHDRVLEGEDAELLLLPADELLDRAQRFAAEGNFREALRHRYISLLVQMDSLGVWRYDTRRTNWEHIAGLRTDAARGPLIAPFSSLTRRFDRVRYGGAECSDEEWNEFERDSGQFSAQIGGAKELAR